MKKILLILGVLGTFTTPALADTVQTNHGWVSLHTQPSTLSSVAGRLQLGDSAQLIKPYNSYWYEVKVNNRILYITTNSNYTHVVKSDTPQQTGSQSTGVQSSGSQSVGQTQQQPSQQTTGNPQGQTQLTLTQQQQKLMEVAKSQIGTPWKWGTQIPNVGFDCSNFTSWVYKTALNIHFSSSSRTQRYDNSIGKPVTIDPNNKLANLQVGDLLFFANSADPNGGGHVGMYAGDGYIIQCGGGRGKVTYEKMQGTWFLSNLVYAKRIL